MELNLLIKAVWYEYNFITKRSELFEYAFAIRINIIRKYRVR